MMFFFFFKQKTAYDMRISDWSSDVCSSDLIPYDSTPFIAASIKEVLLTLGQAMVLVVLVMLVFLQSWRATIIPSIVIPITLAGTCLGLWLVGFSINQIGRASCRERVCQYV